MFTALIRIEKPTLTGDVDQLLMHLSVERFERLSDDEEQIT